MVFPRPEVEVDRLFVPTRPLAEEPFTFPLVGVRFRVFVFVFVWVAWAMFIRVNIISNYRT